MFRRHIVRQVFPGSRKLPVLKLCLIQNRCVTAAASNKEVYDDSALANAKPFEKIPSMPMVPFLGTGWAFLPIVGKYDISKQHLAAIDKRRRLGDIFREKFGPINMVISFNPDDMQVIFKHEGPYPSRGEFSSLKAYRESRKDWYTTTGLMVLHKLTPHLLQEIVEYALHLGYLHRSDSHTVGQCSAPSVLISFGGGGAGEAFFDSYVFFMQWTLKRQGKDWRDLRSKTQKHLMKPKAVQAYLNPMQDVAREFVDKMSKNRDNNKEVPNFLGELYKWALESVALVGLDTRLGCFSENSFEGSDGQKMIDSVQTQFECMNKLEGFSGNLPIWKIFPTPTWKRFAKAGDTFTEIAFKYINRSVEDLKKIAESGEKEMTLLQAMLMTKDLDLSGAMVTVADMLTAGIDTTSHSVGFLLYHLARNPDKQELLHKEIIKLLPMKEDRITPSVFNEMKYLKACMKESSRLHPIVGGVARSMDHDVVFSGYKIPAGTLLVVGSQQIYVDEKYFPNPNQFLPERWLNKDDKMHPFSYVPFGIGPRSCIGRRLAEQEIICLISEILRRFRVEYHHDDIGMYTRLVNTPDKPLRFNFSER